MSLRGFLRAAVSKKCLIAHYEEHLMKIEREMKMSKNSVGTRTKDGSEMWYMLYCAQFELSYMEMRKSVNYFFGPPQTK